MNLTDSQKPLAVKGAEAIHALLGRRVKYRLSAKFLLACLGYENKIYLVFHLWKLITSEAESNFPKAAKAVVSWSRSFPLLIKNLGFKILIRYHHLKLFSSCFYKTPTTKNHSTKIMFNELFDNDENRGKFHLFSCLLSVG